MNNELSFVILGREPSLGFAEVYQYLDKGHVEQCGREFVIIRNKEEASKAAEILGGVPKSGKILQKTDEFSPELLADILRPYISEGKKFHFGLSVYSEIKSRTRQNDFKRIGIAIKKILKNQGSSVRLVESKNSNLSSVDVVKNKLLSSGVELCIFIIDKDYFIGKTETVQPFEDYSHRDYDRPARNAKSGMLPPKLAKMMINIVANNQQKINLLDPFCGSGTIIQEALLAGLRATGTDNDAFAVSDSQKNLQWLTKQYNNLLPWKIEQSDARDIGRIIKPKSVDVIVSEFYLGSPLSGGEEKPMIMKMDQELSDLYGQVLPILASVLKDNGSAVFAWPYWRELDVFISVFNKLSCLGWEIVEPYPKEYQKMFSLSGRGTLLYGRSDQRVWREILVLKKK